MSTGVSKIVAERNHRILAELVLKPGNDICADCKARAPRWASYNLGIFICMNCASIHRKIGTHVTKVKSITLDQWTKEQVEVMKEKGNIKSNALYNPNEARHPPPTNLVDLERDSELEKFIRSKYELKRFIDRKSQKSVVDPGATSTALRPTSTPLMGSAQIVRETSPGPPPPPKTPETLPPRLQLSATVPSVPRSVPIPTRSASQPLPPLTSSATLTTAPPFRQAATQLPAQKPAGQVWVDLVSLQEPSQSSSLPLQYNPTTLTTSLPSQPQVLVQQQPTTLGGAPNPFMNLSHGQVRGTAPLVVSPISLSTPGPQFPPLPSPALHLGATNPFDQALSNVNGTVFPAVPGSFSSSPTVPMAISAPTTPSVQPVVGYLIGAPLPTPPISDVPSQPFAPQPPPFRSPAPAGLAQNPFALTGAQIQMPFSGSAGTNPFSAVQMGQAGFSAAATPQSPFQTAAFPSQQPRQHQQQQLEMHRFGGWAGQGMQGTF